MGNEASRQRLTESLDLLESQDISENDTEFWSNLVRGRCSINELQEIFTHSKLRNIRTHQRGNFVRLVRKVGEIILLYADHGVITESEQSHAHTAMVMFIRSMPLIFEESDVDLERQIFWGIHIYDPSTFLQDCVGDHDLDSISTQYASQGHGDRSATSDVEEFVPETVLMDGLLYEARPLALKVIDAILSLMFSANFTICWEKSLISDKTWNKFGSKSETTIPEQSLCENRHILLECLLVCLMEPLYRPQAKTVPSRWLSYLTTAHYVNHREIFFSLFNVVVGYDLVGWGVPFVGSLMQDDHESLAWTALRILLILLDTNHHDFQTIPRSPNNPDVGNLFLSFLRNNLSQNDAEFVLQHISRMLKAQVSIQEGFIPNGYKSLAFVKELTHLLWLLLKTSPMVYQHATESEETTKLVLILVSVAYYDIQPTERFCQRLSAPCTENLGIGMPVFYGNYGDFVALFFMDLISKSGLISPSLGSVLFSTITNISKHVRIQSLATCMSLRLMVAIFGSQWLKDRNNQSREVLLYIFEFVNTQLYFHQQGIGQLIYQLWDVHRLIRNIVKNLKTQQPHMDPSSVSIEVLSQPPSPCRPSGLFQQDFADDSAPDHHTDPSNTQDPEMTMILDPNDPTPLMAIFDALHDVLHTPLPSQTRTGARTKEMIEEFLSQTPPNKILPLAPSMRQKVLRQNSSLDEYLTRGLWNCIFVSKDPLLSLKTTNLLVDDGDV